MAIEIAVRASAGWVHPASPEWAEIAREELKDGHEYKAVFKRSRSHPQNGRYWVMLRDAVDSGAVGEMTVRSLHKWLLIATGHFTPIQDLRTGDIHRVPDSTSFSSMGQDEFGAYFQAADRVLLEVTGIDFLALAGAR